MNLKFCEIVVRLYVKKNPVFFFFQKLDIKAYKEDDTCWAG